jgi:hypothetical protein
VDVDRDEAECESHEGAVVLRGFSHRSAMQTVETDQDRAEGLALLLPILSGRLDAAPMLDALMVEFRQLSSIHLEKWVAIQARALRSPLSSGSGPTRSLAWISE